VEVWAEEVVGAAEDASEVGFATAVDDTEGRADVDGCTYVIEVPAATPALR